jgi:hypothetical protein
VKVATQTHFFGIREAYIDTDKVPKQYR